MTRLPNFVMIPKTKKIYCNTQVSIAILCHCFIKAQTDLVKLLCQGTSRLDHTVVKAQNVLDDMDTGYFIIRLKSDASEALRWADALFKIVLQMQKRLHDKNC